MSPTISTRTARLEVPGASIYYEVRGSGPILVMMPGGPADASAFHKVAEHLDSDFTVVTYDPRGLSHSSLERPVPEDRLVQIFADDVSRLIEATTSDPAFVFASSGGAVIALELAVRHPEQVRTVVPHEPPAPALMADPARERAAMEDIVATYRTAGVGPAMQKFMVQSRIRHTPPPPPPGEPTPEMREAAARFQRNMDFWIAGPYFSAIAAYEPDIERLKSGSTRVVPAVGDESAGELAHEGGLRLAQRLGTQATVFPGAHGGFESHAPEFAARLREVLRQPR
jgi:pimeloyl-ACP methyl ester carboxylesterase